MKALLLSLAVLLFALASFSNAENYGQMTSLTANNRVTIQYLTALTGPSLEIEVDRNANVTIQLYVSAQLALPEGCLSLSFGANVGFELVVSPPDANLVYARLTTPSLTVAAAALITGSNYVSAFFFDAESNYYGAVDAQYSLISQTIEVDLPVPGPYVFVAIDYTAPIPTLYEWARAIEANVETKISYAGGLFLTIEAESDTSVTANFSSTNPEPEEPADGSVSISAFFTFENSNSAQFNATIEYEYDTDIVAELEIDESGLRIGFFNSATGEWEFQAGGSVDVSANVVFQTTTHFSTWGVYGPADDGGDGGDGDGDSDSAARLHGFLALALLPLLF